MKSRGLTDLLDLTGNPEQVVFQFAALVLQIELIQRQRAASLAHLGGRIWIAQHLGEIGGKSFCIALRR